MSNCQFPFYNKYNSTECITYAQYIKTPYTIVQSIFLIITSLSIIINSTIFYFYYHFFNTKRYQYIGLVISNLFLLLDFIDPFSYNNIIPYTFDVIFSDLTTWCSLIVFTYIILLLINIDIIHIFTNSSQFNIHYKFKLLIILYITITFILNIIFSIFQGLYDKNIWRSIKLSFLALFELSLVILLNILIKNLIINSRNNINFISRIYYKTSIFNFIISSIISFQIFISINIHNQQNYNFEPKITFYQLLLPSFQVLSNTFASIIFIKNYNLQNYNNDLPQ